MRNNRIVKYIAIVFGSIFVICLIRFWWSDFIGADYKSKSELETVLLDNLDLFTEVANGLENVPDDIKITRNNIIGYTISYIRYDSPEVPFKVVNQISKLPIRRLMTFCDIETIRKKHGNLFFVQATNLSFAVGLEYSATGKPFEELYTLEFDEIKKPWYYYMHK